VRRADDIIGGFARTHGTLAASMTARCAAAPTRNGTVRADRVGSDAIPGVDTEVDPYQWIRG
jgi:hypothetical protein